MKPLERAIEVLGSQSAVARAIGGKVKQAHIWYWLNEKDGEVPSEHCAAIEEATREKGDAVTREELRPDVFRELNGHAVDVGHEVVR